MTAFDAFDAGGLHVLHRVLEIVLIAHNAQLDGQYHDAVLCHDLGQFYLDGLAVDINQYTTAIIHTRLKQPLCSAAMLCFLRCYARR